MGSPALKHSFEKKIDLAKAERSELIQIYTYYKSLGNEWLKKQIIENNRIDILTTVILGYELKPFHLAMQRFQFLHPQSLQLAYRGCGKCFKPGTKILMYNGSIKKVENIKVDDLVMGFDSQPRKVLNLSKGEDNLYKVEPIKGESFVCNSNHILTLKGRGYHKGKIKDFPIKDAIELGRNCKRGTTDLCWKLFRVPVKFEKKELPINPYFFGLWLGDGTLKETHISNPDKEILRWVKKYAFKIGYECVVHIDEKKCPRISIVNKKERKNLLRRYFRTFDEKYIPKKFLINSRKNRLKLLAGLLDTDGHYCGGCYEIVQKNKKLAKQIVFLARSLGFAAYIKKKIGTIKERNFSGIYWRIIISGEVNEIPCRIKRKKAGPRKQVKDVRITGFSIHKYGWGKYCGFEVDGDGRFLLADFTVVHNSTCCTIAKSIHYVLKNPNFRLCLASKSSSNAEGFLKEIKGHFESNEKLEEVFGKYYDSKKSTKWDNREIEVLPRTIKSKESTITCFGIESTIVSKHYDATIFDDLIDEDNSRTGHMRNKTQVFYYQTLDPILEAPDPKILHRGEHHGLGTRYHYKDLYGHLIENELKEHHQIIPGLNEKGQTPWPEKTPPEYFAEKRKRSGIIIFNAQYQCNTEAMKGEIFQYDDCQIIDESDIPKDLKIFMGIDLAISQEEQADHFAIVIIGIDSNKNYYILDFYDGQLRFVQQTRKIKEFHDKWDPIRAGIEINAYQDAQYQESKRKDKNLRLKPVNQIKDKITRAWKLSSIFDDKRMFFKKSGRVHFIIEQLVLFPSDKKDLFDALDLAVRVSKRRKRKERKPFGLL